MQQLIKTLIDQFEEVHHGYGWIGVNFDKKINDLSPDEFFHQAQGMHSIAEIISHLTVWRKEAILKIKTGQGSMTDDNPSNWKSNKELQRLGKDTILLKHNESLSKLIALLKLKNDTFLKETYFDTDFKGNYPYTFLIHGMLHHDLYHLGQIGLLIKCKQSNS